MKIILEKLDNEDSEGYSTIEMIRTDIMVDFIR